MQYIAKKFATYQKKKNSTKVRLPKYRSLTDRYIVFLKGDKFIKSHMMDALGRKDDERRDWLRKASVRCQ